MEFQEVRAVNMRLCPSLAEYRAWKTVTKDSSLLCSKMRLIVYHRFVVVWLRVITKVRFGVFNKVFFGKMNRRAYSSKYGFTTQIQSWNWSVSFLSCLFEKTSEIHLVYLFYMIPGKKNKQQRNTFLSVETDEKCREIVFSPQTYYFFRRIWEWAVLARVDFFFM